MANDQGQPAVTGRAAELRIGTLWLDATLCLRAFDPLVADLFGISRSALEIGRPLLDANALPAAFRVWVSRTALELRVAARWADAHRAAGMAPAMGGGWSLWVAGREALDRDSEPFEQVLAAIPSPVYFKDLNGRYLGCNRAFEEYLGVPRHELIGKHVFEVAPGARAESYHDADLEGLPGRGRVAYEASVDHADGERRDVLFHKSAFHARSGEVAGIVGVMTDLSAQKRIEREYRLAASVFDHAAEAITITDDTPVILKVNRAFTQITGFSAAEVVGKNPSLLSSGRQDRAFYAGMWQRLREEGYWFGEIVNRRKNGEDFPEMLSITAVRDENGRPANYIGIFTDLSQAKDAEAKIERLSLYDALTELPNRTLFVDRLRQGIAHADRRQTPVGVLLIGLDGLRRINDTMGYDVGDQVLRLVAGRLQGVLRSGDTVARYMSDQFAVALSELHDAPDAGTVAANVLHELAQPLAVGGKELVIGAHIGVAIYPRDGADPAALIHGADVAMHHAKREGRNLYQFFSTELEQHTLERLMLETSLRSALDRDEFILHYQPQVDADSCRIVGVEALIRWRHPEMGLVPPGRFIALAEETGQIIAIGDWVLRTACRQARTWLDAGHRLPVSVNLSARQFRQRDLAERVEAILAECRLPPDLIELELTESMVMHDPECAVKALRRLREMGVRVSIDDFGTGYSSLSYLKRFEIDKLKIDRSFVSDIPHDANDMAIAGAVIALGKSLKLRVVAEGVETRGQFEFLRSQGCDDIQGYYFSRPVAAAAIDELLARETAGAPLAGACLAAPA